MDAGALQQQLALAMQYFQAQRPRDVENVIAPILKVAPNHPDALLLMAISCQQQNRVEEAISHARKAAGVAPQNANILGTLGTILAGAGREDEAIETFRQLVQHNPQTPQAFLTLGMLLAQMGRHSEAVPVFEEMAKLTPDQPHGHINLANVLYETTDYENAAKAAAKAAELSGDDLNISYTLGKAQLASGRPREALAAFDKLAGGGSFELKSLAYREVALRELGRDGEADAIGRLQDYVWPLELTPPSGFASIEDFNEALCAEILEDARREEAPTHRATRNGTKVSNLLSNPSPLMKAFGDRLKEAIAEMQSHLQQDASDGPFPTSPPGAYGIELWANIMERQGHQLPHFHPEGWLSGCYYARLPSRVETSGEGHEGWIEFGRPAYHLPHTKEPTTRIVKPKEGMVVLFPSYLFHHTIPFESDEHRISVAFDVIPQSWQSTYRKNRFAGEV